MYKFLLILLLFSCSPKILGPNYNQGRTHNEEKSNRMRVVMKEDKRSKKAMHKVRKSASRGVSHKRSKHRKTRRYIN